MSQSCVQSRVRSQFLWVWVVISFCVALFLHSSEAVAESYVAGQFGVSWVARITTLTM